MRVLVIGSGRMGIRHIQGALKSKFVNSLTIVDLSLESLSNARIALGETVGVDVVFLDVESFSKTSSTFDVGILATTAGNRLRSLELIGDRCSKILIEKPLGQSFESVLDIKEYIELKKLNVFVNLNMRITPSFVQLKKDLKNFTQFDGKYLVTISLGALGIGANGIHFLDYLFFLFDPDEIRLNTGYVDEVLIPSGRGSQFNDYGGWCLLDVYKGNTLISTVFVSIASTSSVFGSMDFVGAHGRISIDFATSERKDYLRKPTSELPVYRYHGDYESPVLSEFIFDDLADLTHSWITDLARNIDSLPTFEESIPCHKLMFEWLSLGNNKNFSIT